LVRLATKRQSTEDCNANVKRLDESAAGGR
jgi:hypothetical protein